MLEKAMKQIKMLDELRSMILKGEELATAEAGLEEVQEAIDDAMEFLSKAQKKVQDLGRILEEKLYEQDCVE